MTEEIGDQRALFTNNTACHFVYQITVECARDQWLRVRTLVRGFDQCLGVVSIGRGYINGYRQYQWLWVRTMIRVDQKLGVRG